MHSAQHFGLLPLLLPVLLSLSLSLSLSCLRLSDSLQTPLPLAPSAKSVSAGKEITSAWPLMIRLKFSASASSTIQLPRWGSLQNISTPAHPLPSSLSPTTHKIHIPPNLHSIPSNAPHKE